jgi:negative regulator of sigma E activity
MAERWVRPPLVARERRPEWVDVWRFRLAALVVLAVLVVAVVLLFRALTGATAQDPGLGALAMTTASTTPMTTVAGGPD